MSAVKLLIIKGGGKISDQCSVLQHQESMSDICSNGKLRAFGSML
jgi:hypothetical protein